MSSLDRVKALYPFTTALHHYARGISLSVLCSGGNGNSGNVDGSGSSSAGAGNECCADAAVRHVLSDAVHELQLFREATARVPATHVMHNNLCSRILAVGEQMLQGEIMYRLAELLKEGRGQRNHTLCVICIKCIISIPYIV